MPSTIADVMRDTTESQRCHSHESRHHCHHRSVNRHVHGDGKPIPGGAIARKAKRAQKATSQDLAQFSP